MAAKMSGSETLPGNEAKLWRAFARSVRDNVVGESTVQILRVGSTIVLARTLTTEDFGVFRILLVVGVFATLLSQGGIPDALIQRDRLRPEHEATGFWLSVGLATVVAGGLYVGAPFIAHAMGMPRVTLCVRLLCLPLLFMGTASVGNARLRRELRFGALALADVLGEVAFIAVALWLLANRMPAWSLPGGLAARFTLRAGTIWAADGRLPIGAPSLRAARDFGRFASTVCGAKLLTNVSANADYVLVGSLLGAPALGLYSIASELLRFVPNRFHRVAGQVTYPAFCRLRSDGRQLANAYRDFFGYVVRIVPTVAVCGAVLAPELLATAYGHKWIAAAPVMRLLAAGLALEGLQVGIGSVYYATDHPSYDIYLHAGRLALIVAAVFALSGKGLLGVSAAMSAVEGTMALVGLTLACALVGLGARELLTVAAPGLRVAVLSGITAFAMRYLALAAGLDASMVLVTAAIPAALVYLWVERSNLSAMMGRGPVVSPAQAEGLN